MLLSVGLLLTLVFTAFSLCVAVLIEDRARGLGAALFVWLLTTLIYDGLILLVTTRSTNTLSKLPCSCWSFSTPWIWAGFSCSCPSMSPPSWGIRARCMSASSVGPVVPSWRS